MLRNRYPEKEAPMGKTKKVTLLATSAILILAFVSEDVRLNAQALADSLLALFDAAVDVKENIPE